MPGYREQAFLLGIEGIALIRGALEASDDFIETRMREMHEILDLPGTSAQNITELDVAQGYSSLAPAYDSEPDAFIQAEEPVVYDIVDRLPTGTALDAACGTGRHTVELLSKGHRVIGIDQSERMLEQAAAKAPGATLRRGELTALPLPDDSVDLSVCALALTHLTDIGSAIGELARVTRPGGTVITTDMHPTMVALRGTFLFRHGDELGMMRSLVHPVGEYLTAFAEAGLDVRQCVEPEFNGLLPPNGHERRYPEAARAAWGGLPSLLIWNLRVR